MVDALGDLLDGGRLKLYCVPSFDRESWTRRDLPLEERARRHGHYEWWVLDAARAVRAGRLAHARADRDRLLVRRLPRRELLPQARRPLPARDRHERRLRRHGAGRGRARRRHLLQQPDGLRREPARRPPRLAARRTRRSLLVCGQGQWEDTTGALESTKRFGSLLGREGHPARGRPLGTRRPARLAVVAAPDRASSASLCLIRASIGLLLGTEEDWPAAFEALVSRLGPVDGHTLRTERILNEPFDLRSEAALLARHRPARVVVRPAARVAEEDLADGRRLPAEQPVHLPGDGEALRVLRADAARDPRAGDLADPAQGAARQPALPADGRALQRAVRPRGDRRAHRLPALHEAVRRRPVGRRLARRLAGRAARALRRVGRADDAPADRARGLRRVRPLTVDRRRDDVDVVRPVEADVRPLPGAARLPDAGARRRDRHASRGS